MKAPLTILRDIYADPYAAARAHRAAGGKVVGYLLNSVPEELIIAAGCFPVRLRGDPARLPPLAERYMEEYLDGEVRSLFGALLEGRFDFVDLLVIPRNSEVYLQLYYFLLEMPKWEPQARIPPLYLLDLLQTPSATTLRYVAGRLHDFANRLSEISGRSTTAPALSKAINTVNAKRTSLQTASRLWQSPAPALNGVDALTVISAASFAAHDTYMSALKALIADPPAAASPKARLLLKGSPQSDLRFTALVVRVGAGVVAHDHLWGDRTYSTAVPEDGDPWHALARHYSLDIPSPREYPQAKADQSFLSLIEKAHVQGVIFFHDEWDDTLGWEYPDQKKLLEQRGVPSVFLKRQRYFDPDGAQQTEGVRALLESLQHRS